MGKSDPRASSTRETLLQCGWCGDAATRRGSFCGCKLNVCDACGMRLHRTGHPCGKTPLLEGPGWESYLRRLVRRGMSTRQIAKELQVSQATVQRRVAAMRR